VRCSAVGDGMAVPRHLRKSSAVDSPGSLVGSGWLGWERAPTAQEAPLPGSCASKGRPATVTPAWAGPEVSK
jgi:hypothetical protein